VRDVVRPGCGVLVKRGDGSGFGTAIARLAGDPALRARMGAAARRHVALRFSAERLLDDIEGLYRELLAAPPRQAPGSAVALGASAR
jgi:glycosyltransferase involved in cell wall biosynthesis